MGCCSSSSSGDGAGADVPGGRDRRRLSVSDPGAKPEGEEAGAAENDRGLITQLDGQAILELLKESADTQRKMSIGSTTDTNKMSFANKTVKQIGDQLDPEACCLGYTCRKGLKPESPNQDSWCVLKVDGSFSLYAVFDGHGQKGHDVSNFVKDNLPKLILRDNRFKTDEMGAMLKDTFLKMQSLVATADRLKKLSAQMSGTTATVVIHDAVKNNLMVSHVADSSAVLGKRSASDLNKFEAKQLTRDHKPNLKDERARIEKAGGRVVFDGYANHRIYAKNARYPGLNMSRCIGDLLGHMDCGISAEPEVLEQPIKPDDHVLLVCSDGVWEFITPQEAIDIVCAYPPEKAMEAAEKLAKESWDKWIAEEGGAVVDDITVVLVFLNPDKK
uniref:PPM-type phosphatase domain-containing protein n=1 Tax=Alexandrium monilatum TaxID=311494 RepID=A0A7S4VCL9_9DINO|mmetsp:Transcript_40542/g.121174  ORF Transcript_40542/g.121174 Transcript_40542/m.121174 type:complete len:388 (+) Transcript_40542:76-1239(+)